MPNAIEMKTDTERTACTSGAIRASIVGVSGSGAEMDKHAKAESKTELTRTSAVPDSPLSALLDP